MTSIVDNTNLPAHVPEILAKRPEDRTPIEQAVLDAYNKKLGPSGAEKVGEVAGYEADIPSKGQNKVCLRTGSSTACEQGSGGRQCAICNRSGKL